MFDRQTLKRILLTRFRVRFSSPDFFESLLSLKLCESHLILVDFHNQGRELLMLMHNIEHSANALQKPPLRAEKKIVEHARAVEAEPNYETLCYWLVARDQNCHTQHGHPDS